MVIDIEDSVRAAGLEPPVRDASKLLDKIVPRSLQRHVTMTWSVLTGADGKHWLMAAFNYDPRTTELAVFPTDSVEDADFMRERLDRLWNSVLRSRLLQSIEEPLSDMVGVE